MRPSLRHENAEQSGAGRQQSETISQKGGCIESHVRCDTSPGGISPTRCKPEISGAGGIEETFAAFLATDEQATDARVQHRTINLRRRCFIISHGS